MTIGGTTGAHTYGGGGGRPIVGGGGGRPIVGGGGGRPIMGGGAGGLGAGGDSGALGGYVSGGNTPRPFPIIESLPLRPKDCETRIKFPRSAWRPDFIAKVAVAEFARTDWWTHKVAPPPSDPDDIFTEIDFLVGPAMNQRAALGAEVIDQDGRLIGWFAQTMMLSSFAHPNTIVILEIASQVANMVAFHYKSQFDRARPQQVCPALVPMVVSPWHASYPSGHSLEGHLIAWALGEVLPRLRPVLMDLADRIGINREVAGVHYPSDTEAGKDIAQAVARYFHECPSFRRTLDAAQREHGDR